MAGRAYVTRIIPQPGIDLLRQHLDVDINEGDVPLTAEELREKASTYDALVTLLTDKVDASLLEAGKGHLTIIANVAVGYDNIDLPAATQNNILVSNTPGVLTDTTADFAWALMMTAARRVCEAQSFLRSGQFQGWGIMMMLGQDVHHKTLGLVGFGRIGQAVARRATGFGMRILYYDPVIRAEDVAADLGAEQVELDFLLHESDFVSLHTPLSPETTHLINADRLKTMKRNAVLVNTSRGPVIDETALAEALRDGIIAAAGLDVFEHEPAVNADLLRLDNVVLAPHIASASVETRTRMATMAAENVIAVLDGKPGATVLNPEARSAEHDRE